MTFKKGTSANPAGRPKGSGEVARLRTQLAQHVPDVVKKVVEAAKSGDMQAARIFLDRVIPSLRAEAADVRMPVPAGGSLTERAEALLAAAAAGKVPPSIAADLIGAIGTVARIREVDELRRRLDALEVAAGKEYAP